MLSLLLLTLASFANSHEFVICQGEFALCAASICYPTGHDMKVNNSFYPEMSCLCPIFTGHAIADLQGGNMNGTCRIPEKEKIWSLYAIKRFIPQEMNNWKCNRNATVAPGMYCNLNETEVLSSDVNCFSFLCTRTRPIHGISMANCSCPLFEDLNGERSSGRRFLTQTGQKNSKYCLLNPVGLQTMYLVDRETRKDSRLVSDTCSLEE